MQILKGGQVSKVLHPQLKRKILESAFWGASIPPQLGFFVYLL